MIKIFQKMFDLYLVFFRLKKLHFYLLQDWTSTVLYAYWLSKKETTSMQKIAYVEYFYWYQAFANQTKVEVEKFKRV